MQNVSRSILSLGVVLTLTACGKESPKADTAQTVVVPPTAAGVAPHTALTDLRWIVGSFRGAGAQGTVQAPFFERYSLVGDSTLVVESFKDSTLKGAADSTRYVLHGDSLTSPDAAATNVSPGSVTFSSRKNRDLAWTWRRDDDNTWTAIIVNAVPNAPPKTRVYHMARLK
ncbi:MAG: hypothetical protein ABI625_27950 [bacterium]